VSVIFLTLEEPHSSNALNYELRTITHSSTNVKISQISIIGMTRITALIRCPSLISLVLYTDADDDLAPAQDTFPMKERTDLQEMVL